MTSVVVARIASAIGSESDSAFCWSRKPAVCPPTRTGTGAVDRADVAHELLGLLAERAAAARRGRSGRGRRPAARCGATDDAGQRAEPLRVALDRRAVARPPRAAM